MLALSCPVGREIPEKPNNTRGPRPSWRSAVFMYPTIWDVVTTRRDILLLLLFSKFLTFTGATTRFTSHFDGSLAPKVVQIIVSYNNLRAFFVIFRVFGGFFEIFGANFGLWACCSPTAEGCASLRASCSPPRWGGGELRGSKNRNNSHASASPAAGTISD